MSEPLFNSWMDLIAGLADREFGSPGFFIMMAAFWIAVILVLRLLSGAFGSDRGIVVCAFAAILSWGLSSIGYVLTEVYVVPLLADFKIDWLSAVVPWVGMALVLLLSIKLIAVRMVGINLFGLCILFFFAGLAGLGCRYGAGLLMNLAEAGQGQRELNQDRLEQSIEAME